MSAGNFQVVYDILSDGIGLAEVGVCLMILAGFAVGVGTLASAKRKKMSVGNIVCWVLWLILWITLGSIGVSNVLYQHFRCVAWAKAGDFQVTEGLVTFFDPLERSEKGTEKLTVNEHTFAYGDAILSQGGFRNAFGPDGPIRVGTYVRVAHREGRILRLEIRRE